MKDEFIKLIANYREEVMREGKYSSWKLDVTLRDCKKRLLGVLDYLTQCGFIRDDESLEEYNRLIDNFYASCRLTYKHKLQEGL